MDLATMPEGAATVAQFAVPDAQAGVITREAFAHFLELFGPVEGCLMRAHASLFEKATLHPWFHGAAPKAEVQALLKDTPTGAGRAPRSPRAGAPVASLLSPCPRRHVRAALFRVPAQRAGRVQQGQLRHPRAAPHADAGASRRARFAASPCAPRRADASLRDRRTVSCPSWTAKVGVARLRPSSSSCGRARRSSSRWCARGACGVAAAAPDHAPDPRPCPLAQPSALHAACARAQAQAPPPSAAADAYGTIDAGAGASQYGQLDVSSAAGGGAASALDSGAGGAYGVFDPSASLGPPAPAKPAPAESAYGAFDPAAALSSGTFGAPAAPHDAYAQFGLGLPAPGVGSKAGAPTDAYGSFQL